MNNRFKFRVWDGRQFWRDIFIHNGEPYVRSFTEELVPLFSQMQIELYGNPVIQQFTGLKDKNGRDIYEGDIMIGKFYDKNGEIIFENCRFSLKTKSGYYYLPGVENLEIIGNIFENKNLLCNK